MGEDHRLRIRILWILKVPKIHEFLRILKLSILKFIKFKLSHSSPPSSNKFFVANTALNLWIKSSVMSTVQDSLTRKQFSMIMSRLLQSMRIACSFTVSRVSESQSSIITAHCSIQCNRLCEIENFAVTSDAIKRTFTNFKNFVKFANFYEFYTRKSRILNLWVKTGAICPHAALQSGCFQQVQFLLCMPTKTTTSHAEFYQIKRNRYQRNPLTRR